mmetsp:Transcript_11679/g.20732  ORF Transcript_11679/g.20732 Transcript_11679/m.20732 type:complete len:142 (+) Transcript_11679:651-1076(+)
MSRRDMALRRNSLIATWYGMVELYSRPCQGAASYGMDPCPRGAITGALLGDRRIGGAGSDLLALTGGAAELGWRPQEDGASQAPRYHTGTEVRHRLGDRPQDRGQLTGTSGPVGLELLDPGCLVLGGQCRVGSRPCCLGPW